MAGGRMTCPPLPPIYAHISTVHVPSRLRNHPSETENFMTHTTYTFGLLAFSNTDELSGYCENLRHACSPGTPIEGTDNHELLSKLFHVLLKNRERLKGKEIAAWTTKTNTAGTHSLAAVLKDGRTVSFSVKKAISAYVSSQSRTF